MAGYKHRLANHPTSVLPFNEWKWLHMWEPRRSTPWTTIHLPFLSSHQTCDATPLSSWMFSLHAKWCLGLKCCSSCYLPHSSRSGKSHMADPTPLLRLVNLLYAMCCYPSHTHPMSVTFTLSAYVKCRATQETHCSISMGSIRLFVYICKNWLLSNVILHQTNNMIFW